MKSLEQERSYFINPYTNLKNIRESGSLAIKKGEGIYVYDENNNKYLEGLAGLWCVALGFNNQRLIDATKRQLDELPYYHSFTGKVPLTTDLRALALARVECSSSLVTIYEGHIVPLETLRHAPCPLHISIAFINPPSF